MDIIKYARYPAWAAAFLGRFALMAFGLVMAPLSLLGDGADRTPSMWRWLLGNVEDIPKSWTFDDVPGWSYAYVPIMFCLAWYGYGNWHPLVAIYFIFATFASALVSVNRDKWTKFWWMGIRNPVEGLDGTLTQPVAERKPNPDEIVRGTQSFTKKAVRFMDEGWFWEYWSLSRIESGPFAGRFWEFRIGWKFVDGNEDFVPTFQIGPKK